MAIISTSLKVILIKVCLLSSICVVQCGHPSIDNVELIQKKYVPEENRLQIVARLKGRDLRKDLLIRPTYENITLGEICYRKNDLIDMEINNSSYSSISVGEDLSNQTDILITFLFPETVEKDKILNVSFCVADAPMNTSSNFSENSLQWIYWGGKISIQVENNDHTNQDNATFPPIFRNRKVSQMTDNRIRRRTGDTTDPSKPDSDPSVRHVELYGIRLENSEPKAEFEPEHEGAPTLLVNTEATIRLFGTGWTNNTMFALTEHPGKPGDKCEFLVGGKDPVVERTDGTYGAHTILLHMVAPAAFQKQFRTTYYFCVKEKQDKEFVFYHLGSENFQKIHVRERIIPIWAQLVIIVVCLSFSCLFSGLNLGLLSLSLTDLKIISNTGTETERGFARAIYPVRLHGNYLLCSILLGNTLVNSIFTILLDDLSSGIVAILISTIAIVMCGEILPQAVCSRHGLAIGARTIYITKTAMVLTAPLAYPISKVLDIILGEELTNLYTRERLKELVKVTTEFNDLENDEVNIIAGALELRRKLVADVMTPLDDVFMLSNDIVLDFETVSEIMQSGFSRIPVYEGNRKNVVSLLYIKDLALIDPDDNTPLRVISEFYKDNCFFTFDDVTLDVLLKQFKDGGRGHMAFVWHIEDKDKDPWYDTVGIVTLEDVIEELIQSEIVDETDVYTDNRSKQKRAVMRKNLTYFSERSVAQRIRISPQLSYAAFQFLSSSVDAFKSENISETVLLRLLKQDIIHHIKVKDKQKDDSATVIYLQGKPADYFVLILEGRVEVTVGQENLLFESGPFTYFGSQALLPNIGVGECLESTPNASGANTQAMGSLQSVNLESMLHYTFIPDYTVRAVSDVYYLKIKRSFYLAAKKVTIMEHCKKISNAGDHFDIEMERICKKFEMDSMMEDNKSLDSKESAFNTPLNFIDCSRVNTPPRASAENSPENISNGGLSTTVSPSRTPRGNADSVQMEEKATLLNHSKNASHSVN